jgi:hypothetical protein
MTQNPNQKEFIYTASTSQVTLYDYSLQTYTFTKHTISFPSPRGIVSNQGLPYSQVASQTPTQLQYSSEAPQLESINTYALASKTPETPLEWACKNICFQKCGTLVPEK